MDKNTKALSNLEETKNLLQNEQGQSIIEFVMLMLILTTISYVMLAGLNNGIAGVWEAIVKLVASPTPENLVNISIP
ncbi:MAG: hypothetical protein ACPGJV_12590 [Bacteriovoracaceae bacterium]